MFVKTEVADDAAFSHLSKRLKEIKNE